MKSTTIVFGAALAVLALPLFVQGRESRIEEAYSEMSRNLAESASRYRYIVASHVCVNSRGERGYNEIDYARRNGECSNLRHQRLSGRDFSGFNLRGADLTSASLAGANLRGADLTGATLFVANFTRADLTDAVLNYLDMNSSTLVGAVFVRASLVMTNMKGANMNEADFREADFSASDLRYTTYAGTNFRGAVYDTFTLLPFGEASAHQRGMALKPGRHQPPSRP